ncbi:MAG: hypothetical protein RIE73_34250 [Coleofasciculus sp. C1-SOL-03]
MFIYTPRQIAETLYFSLRCVDGLQGKGLRYVFRSSFGEEMLEFLEVRRFDG